MKFSSILAFASFALAAPSAVDRRQTTVVGTIRDSVNTLDSTTRGNIASIQNATATIKQSTDAQVVAQAQANISSDLQAIVSALTAAATNIAGATTGAAGGVAQAAQNLNQAQLNAVAESLRTAARIFTAFEATARVAATDLRPEALQALNSEIAAVTTAVAPFVGPLAAFATAATAASATAGLAVFGVVTAQQDLLNAVLRLYNLIGV